MKRLADLMELIAMANAGRVNSDGAGQATSARATDAERMLESEFEPHRTLAVYGSLAPGKQNHHVVEPLGGQWSQGIVHGDLAPDGWGASLGYPAFRPRAGGTAVPVHVLRSSELPGAWPMLDQFEGADYLRILVPVFSPAAARIDWPTAVANLYAAAPLSKH